MVKNQNTFTPYIFYNAEINKTKMTQFFKIT